MVYYQYNKKRIYDLLLEMKAYASKKKNMSDAVELLEEAKKRIS